MSNESMRSRGRSWLLVCCLAALTAVFAVAATVTWADQAGPPSGDGIQPELVAGNPKCSDYGLLGYSTNSWSVPEVNGNHVIAGVGTITIANATNLTFDWSSTFGIDKVIVKGGDNADAYVYNPEDNADTSLHAPYKDDGNPRDISHVEFCYDVETFEPLTAVKTAEGSYDRTVEWTLEKSVDPDSHTGIAGEDAGSSDWTVIADKSETLGNYEVKGSIAIDNPNNVAVDVSVSDELDDGTVADVDCDPDTEGNQSTGTVPASGQLVCSYKALPDDDSAELNTADITSLTEGVDGAMATAPVAFVENLIGDDEVTLGDERFTHSELIDDDTTEVFPETFPCPSDPSEYTNGVHERTETNTATLIGDNTDLSADASVEITCYQVADLHVLKFYDEDMDGVKDAGEEYITGWRVFVNGDPYLTPADLLDIPVGDYEVEEDTPNESNWIHTTPTSESVTLAAGDDKTVEFGNVCLGAGGGHTLGFWSNKNGQALIGAGDLALLVSLNLRNANGSPFDPANKSQFRSWLLSANATNMAYMLSAQLAAMELNVFNGFVDGDSLIYAPDTNSANALGFATVNAVMAEANVELGLNGNTVGAGALRTYQEALKNALDKANNNLTFVQDEPCPFTFPDLSVED